jgi:hypothetical protein
MQKSIIRQSDGLVINRIEYDSKSNWTPPDGHILTDDGKIGQTWDGKAFIDPEPLPEPEPPRDLEAEIDALKADTEKLKIDVKSLKSEASR